MRTGEQEKKNINAVGADEPIKGEAGTDLHRD